MKTCYKCKKIKELIEFSKAKREKDGLQPSCKQCAKDYALLHIEKRKAYQKEYYLTNCEDLKEASRVYYTENTEDILIYKKEFYLENSEEILEKAKIYYVDNIEKIVVYRKLYNAENKDKIKLNDQKYRKANIAKSNAHSAKKRAHKLQATLSCLTQFDLDYIKHLYIQAKELEKLTGIKHHVDHIVPLKGETVCGLHVPWNLQILTAEENMKKSNKFEGEK